MTEPRPVSDEGAAASPRRPSLGRPNRRRPVRRLFVPMVYLAVLVVIGALTLEGGVATPSQAQDTTEDRLSSLETRVAGLEARLDPVAASPVPDLAMGVATPPATPQATPVASVAAAAAASSGGSGQTSIGGSAANLLPPGTAGEVIVVAVGTYDGSRLPLVVRNNTGGEVADVSVSATARDAGGALVASGGDQGFRPNLLRPGELAMGYAYFDGAQLPADAVFEFDAEADAPGGALSRLDLVVDEATLIDDRVVGVLSNPHAETLQGPIGITLTCFSTDGILLGFHEGYSDKETAEPGETVPFQVTLQGGTSCPAFLVAGSGYNF